MEFKDYVRKQQLELAQSLIPQSCWPTQGVLKQKDFDCLVESIIYPYFWPQESVLKMALPKIEIHIDEPTYRLNRSNFPNALYFDNSGSGRFDGSDQGYKILYTGQNADACYVEVFARVNPSSHATTGLANILAQDHKYYKEELQQYSLFRINANRSLILADLTGIGLNQLSGDTGIVAGPHQVSRAWGRAIWENFGENVDGIRYRSRLDNDQYCYGLFEDRVLNNLDCQNLGRLTDYHKLLSDITSYCGHTEITDEEIGAYIIKSTSRR
jgi:hypothetical protein